MYCLLRGENLPLDCLWFCERIDSTHVIEKDGKLIKKVFSSISHKKLSVITYLRNYRNVKTNSS